MSRFNPSFLGRKDEDFWMRYLNNNNADKNSFQVPAEPLNIARLPDTPRQTDTALQNRFNSSGRVEEFNSPASTNTVAGGITGALNLASAFANAMEEKPQRMNVKTPNLNPGKSQTLASDPEEELRKWLSFV